MAFKMCPAIYSVIIATTAKVSCLSPSLTHNSECPLYQAFIYPCMYDPHVLQSWRQLEEL